MKKYIVRLNLPCVMWAIVEVEADSQKQAEEMALEEAHLGKVDFESAGFDMQDAEITDCEESQ